MRERADAAQVMIGRNRRKRLFCPCQKRQPAGTRPVQFLMPSSIWLAMVVAMGGRDRLTESVKTWDIRM